MQTRKFNFLCRLTTTQVVQTVSHQSAYNSPLGEKKTQVTVIQTQRSNASINNSEIPNSQLSAGVNGLVGGTPPMHCE